MSIPVVNQLEAEFAYDPDPSTVNVIPLAAPVSPANSASYEKGFPAITMPTTPTSGLPPQGQDFNGILQAITALSTWYSVGGGFAYNGTLYNGSNPYITGYPVGARVMRADNQGYWLNLVDDNQTDPDSGASAGWVQDNVYGFFNIDIPTNVTVLVTLTMEEAAFSMLQVTQAVALTLDVTIVVPAALLKAYYIENNTDVTINIETDDGGTPTIAIPSGGVSYLFVTSGTTIVDLSQQYLIRPNLGNNGYFAQGTGTATAVTTGGAIIDLNQGAGKSWIASDLVTIPYDGSYTISVTTEIDVTTISPDTIILYLRVNGSSVIGASSLTFVNSGTLPWPVSGQAYLTAGDTVEVFGIESIASGATVEITHFNITLIAN
jgi:hypothetical protein